MISYRLGRGAQSAAYWLGYPSIMSAGLYLDYKTDTWQMFYQAAAAIGKNLKQHIPLLLHGPLGEILGGEMCMWSEVVSPGNLFQTLFPRLAAGAGQHSTPPPEVIRPLQINKRQGSGRVSNVCLYFLGGRGALEL